MERKRRKMWLAVGMPVGILAFWAIWMVESTVAEAQSCDDLHALEERVIQLHSSDYIPDPAQAVEKDEEPRKLADQPVTIDDS